MAGLIDDRTLDYMYGLGTRVLYISGEQGSLVVPFLLHPRAALNPCEPMLIALSFTSARIFPCFKVPRS